MKNSEDDDPEKRDKIYTWEMLFVDEFHVESHPRRMECLGCGALACVQVGTLCDRCLRTDPRAPERGL